MAGNIFRKAGFTIVELLIVIVVIAILAAITIVAYNGIRNQANTSALQSSVSQAAKKIGTHVTLNSDTLPATLQDAGVVVPSTMQYEYIPVTNGSAKGYCVSAVYTQTPRTSYAVVSGSGAVTAGKCITNRVANPSVESTSTGWGLSINGSTSSRSGAAALIGSQGITSTTSSTSDSGVQIPVSGSLTAGTPYTASFRIKAVTAAQYSLSMQGTAGSSNRYTQSLSAGEEATFRYTWTPSTTGGVAFYALRQGGQSGSATFYVDGAVLVEGSTGYTYGTQGESGWLWTGTESASSSVGPATEL